MIESIARTKDGHQFEFNTNRELARGQTMLPRIPECHSNGPVRIELNRTVPGDEQRGLVPFYHFKILDQSSIAVGHINFKVGDTPHVRQYAGHVGYEILPEFRGQSYSFYACRA